MLITVVLSVYNTGKYLHKAMDSLLGQSFRDFEIIIVDDGSTDGSSEICEKEAENRPEVRVFHKQNGGLSSARNFGIEYAEGQFISFPYPDYWVEPDYLEKLIEIRNTSNADLAVCGFYDEMENKRRIWNEGEKSCVLNSAKAMEMLMKPSGFCGYAWNKMYNLKVIRDNCLRFDTELGMVQDLHFAVRYFQFIKTVAYDPVPLYHYNHDSGGVTASYSPLTPRKLSGLLTYRKIGEMTEKQYPRVAEIAYSSLCNMCLQDIYIYYRSSMKDRAALDMLVETFYSYRKYFKASKEYRYSDKMFMNLVPVSPRLYAFLTRIKKIILNRLDRRRKKAWKPL